MQQLKSKVGGWGVNAHEGFGGMWKMEDKEVSSAEDVMYEPLYKCLHGRALAFRSSHEPGRPKKVHAPTSTPKRAY